MAETDSIEGWASDNKKTPPPLPIPESDAPSFQVEPESPTPSGAEPTPDQPLEPPPPRRSRKRRVRGSIPIGVIGFSASGKTVFLSMLYHATAETHKFPHGWRSQWLQGDSGETARYLRNVGRSILGVDRTGKYRYKDESRTRLERSFPPGTMPGEIRELSFTLIRSWGLNNYPLAIRTIDGSGEVIHQAFLSGVENLSPVQREHWEEIAQLYRESAALLVFVSLLNIDQIQDSGEMRMLFEWLLKEGRHPRAVALIVTGLDILGGPEEAEERKRKIEEKYRPVIEMLDSHRINFKIFMVSSLGWNIVRKKTSDIPIQCMGANHRCPLCQELKEDPDIRPDPVGMVEPLEYLFHRLLPWHRKWEPLAITFGIIGRIRRIFFNKITLALLLVAAVAMYVFGEPLAFDFLDQLRSVPPADFNPRLWDFSRGAYEVFYAPRYDGRARVIAGWEDALEDFKDIKDRLNRRQGTLTERIAGLDDFIRAEHTAAEHKKWAEIARENLVRERHLMEIDSAADRQTQARRAGVALGDREMRGEHRRAIEAASTSLLASFNRELSAQYSRALAARDPARASRLAGELDELSKTIDSWRIESGETEQQLRDFAFWQSDLTEKEAAWTREEMENRAQQILEIVYDRFDSLKFAEVKEKCSEIQQLLPDWKMREIRNIKLAAGYLDRVKADIDKPDMDFSSSERHLSLAGNLLKEIDNAHGTVLRLDAGLQRARWRNSVSADEDMSAIPEFHNRWKRITSLADEAERNFLTADFLGAKEGYVRAYEEYSQARAAFDEEYPKLLDYEQRKQEVAAVFASIDETVLVGRCEKTFNTARTFKERGDAARATPVEGIDNYNKAVDELLQAADCAYGSWRDEYRKLTRDSEWKKVRQFGGVIYQRLQALANEAAGLANISAMEGAGKYKLACELYPRAAEEAAFLEAKADFDRAWRGRVDQENPGPGRRFLQLWVGDRLSSLDEQASTLREIFSNYQKNPDDFDFTEPRRQFQHAQGELNSAVIEARRNQGAGKAEYDLWKSRFERERRRADDDLFRQHSGYYSQLIDSLTAQVPQSARVEDYRQGAKNFQRAIEMLALARAESDFLKTKAEFDDVWQELVEYRGQHGLNSRIQTGQEYIQRLVPASFIEARDKKQEADKLNASYSNNIRSESYRTGYVNKAYFEQRKNAYEEAQRAIRRAYRRARIEEQNIYR